MTDESVNEGTTVPNNIVKIPGPKGGPAEAEIDLSQAKQPNTPPVPPNPEDPIVADIKKRTASKYVVDNIVGPINKARELLKSLPERSPTAFRKSATEVLEAMSQSMDAIIEGFRIIEEEDANITVKLHRAYISFVAETDNRIRQEYDQKIAEMGLVQQKQLMVNGMRLNEIIRMEHSTMTLFNALCEKGIFDFDEEAEDQQDTERLEEREERYVRSKTNYMKSSKRLLRTRLGIEPYRNPQGGTILSGGYHVKVWNIVDGNPDEYLSGGTDANS